MKVSKYKKIKRNRNIFGKNLGISPGGVIIWTILIVFFVGCGWFLYDPIYKLVTEGFPKSEVKQEMPPTEQEDNSKTPNITTEDTNLENDTPQKTPNNNISCSYITSDILLNNDKFKSYLDTLNKEKVSSVMIDLKDINGNVLYKTSLDDIDETRIISPNAIDLKSTVSLIKEKGFNVVGRIYSFKDHIAPFIFNKMSVKYMDTNLTWLDNTKENGGKPWLNPYSKEAQNYILDLAKEAHTLGINEIIFDKVEFPSEGYAYANFGKITKTNTEILKDFAEKAENLANEQDFNAYIAVNSSAIFLDNKMYGGNPLDFAKFGIALDLQPSLYTDGFKLPNDKVLENPSAKQGETVEAVLNALKGKINKEKTIAILGSTTTDQLEDQIKKVNDFGIKNYISIMP